MKSSLFSEQMQKILTIRVNVAGEEIVSDLSELGFSSDLNVDISKIPALQAFWSRLAEEANETYANSKAQYDVWWAQMDDYFRIKAEKEGWKLTETKLEAKIKTYVDSAIDPRPLYLYYTEGLNRERKICKILDSVAKAFDSKGDMLQTLSANLRSEVKLAPGESLYTGTVEKSERVAAVKEAMAKAEQKLEQPTMKMAVPKVEQDAPVAVPIISSNEEGGDTNALDMSVDDELRRLEAELEAGMTKPASVPSTPKQPSRPKAPKTPV